GSRLRMASLKVDEGDVTSVAFGPQGRLAAGYEIPTLSASKRSGGGVVLFGANGARLRPVPLEVHEGNVTSVTFGPEGRLAAGTSGGVVLFDAQGERINPKLLKVSARDVTSVAFGPEGHLAAGTSGGVVLFDAQGERINLKPLEVPEGFVRSVAFGPQGRL